MCSSSLSTLPALEGSVICDEYWKPAEDQGLKPDAATRLFIHKDGKTTSVGTVGSVVCASKRRKKHLAVIHAQPFPLPG